VVVGVLATRREPDRLLRTKPSRRLGVHRPQSLSGIDYSYYYKDKNEKKKGYYILLCRHI